MKGTTGNEIDERGVDHPAHYNNHPSGVECIDVIESLGLNVGTAVKYVWRIGLKTSEHPAKDADKAIWYFERGRRGKHSTYSLTANDVARWDLVITHEPDELLRRLYAAVRRHDLGEACFAAKDLRKRYDDDVPSEAG